MNYELCQGTIPHGLKITIPMGRSFAGQVHIGSKKTSLQKILDLAAKVLLDPELPGDDYLRWYAANLKSASIARGYSASGRRLEVLDFPQTSIRNRIAWIDVLGYKISIRDFVVLVDRILTDIDLAPNDPRLAFVERIKNGR